MAIPRQLQIHDVRAEGIKLEAVDYQGTRWISLKIDGFEVTLFASDEADYKGLKNFFMVEDAVDREINDARLRAIQEENVPW